MNLPGWDSIEATTRLHSIFEISGIVILGLLVLAEVIAYKYGHRKEELIAAKDQSDAAERDKKQREKEEQHRSEVATLQTQLDQAKQARTITPEKRADLLACLKAQDKGPVYVRPAQLDAEATAYGKQIADSPGFSGKIPDR